MDIEVVRRESRTIPVRQGSETREVRYTVEIYRAAELHTYTEYVLMELGFFHSIVDELCRIRLADGRERITESAADGAR